MYVNNKRLKLSIFANGETYLYDKSLDYTTSVDLTGFNTDLFLKAASNNNLENSSNKSSETVTRSEDMELIIDIRPEDMEQEDIEKECRGFEANKQAQNTLQEKTTTVETKPFQETRQVKQDEVVDKKEVKSEATPVKNTDTDKKPIKEEVTVRNAPVETPKQYLIKTELVDDELNIDLIKHKEEEQKKKEEEEQKKKEEEEQKKKEEEEQKKKEEEQKKKEGEEQKKKETRSIIPALQDVNKVQTHKENKEESGTFNLLSDMLRNKEKDNKEEDNKEKDNKEQDPSSKKDNQDQGQGTVKDSALIKRKGRYK